MEYKGYTINIVHDGDPENPRNWGNFGKLALFHIHYNLPNDEGLDTEDLNDMQRSNEYIMLPVWGYDHSNFSIKAGDRTYSYNDNWDSGLLGFVYVSKDDVRKEYNKQRLSSATIQKVKSLLIAEVETLNQYYMGDVWGYEIVSSDGDYLDSCYGFYGDVESSGILDCAKEYIDWYIVDQEEKEHKLLSRVEMFI